MQIETEPELAKLRARLRELEGVEARLEVTREALREAERRYEAITRAITDYLFTVYLEDGHPVKTVHSPTCVGVTGYSPGEFERDSFLWFRMVHPDDREAVREQASRILSGREVQPLEHRIVRKDGTVRWVRNTPVLHRDSEGRLVSYEGLIEDITERKLAEEALRASEDNYRSIFDAANDAIFVHDLETGRILDVNRKMCEMWECTPEHAQELLVGDLSAGVPPYTQADALRWIREAAQGEPQVFEWLAKSRTGRLFWVEVNLKCTQIGGQTKVLAVVRDITERKRAEDERLKMETRFRQLQRIEAVGQLAAGVAHDFNNILTAILGNAEVLCETMRVRPPSDETLLKAVEEIIRAARRAESLTRQLLAFGRPHPTRPALINPNRILADMEGLLRRLVGEHIELILVQAPGLWSIQADPGQIEQIVMNLALNARDAMPTGGRVVIETANVVVDELPVSAWGSPRRGPHVMLAVSDTGCGMPPETMERAFEPFFTTKPAGKGTGLGLSTVYGIVNPAGGHITVRSEPGRGTTFKVFLPAAEGGQTEPAETFEMTAVPGGHETILICEDEETVRQFTCQVLGEAGYSVVSATNGQRALERAAVLAAPVDLLITDVVMPGMNGPALVEQLAATQPGVKVLFISGHPSDLLACHGVSDDAVTFLPKPFDRHTLLRRVRDVLDDRRA